jgi:hypothetical protein
VSIKSFPEYKNLLQENYVQYKHFFLNVTQLKGFFTTNLSNKTGKKYVCIPRSFLVINVCNQGKTSCSPCIFLPNVPQFSIQFSFLEGSHASGISAYGKRNMQTKMNMEH